ncbi:MAG: cell division protein FtsL [Granulosicoccus sp.]
MNSTIVSVLVLTALCFCTALGVVFTTHLSREAHAEIGRNRLIIDELDVQWSQLQIEESTFSEYGLVERQAREALDMVFPGLEGSVMIVR